MKSIHLSIIDELAYTNVELRVMQWNDKSDRQDPCNHFDDDFPTPTILKCQYSRTS